MMIESIASGSSCHNVKNKCGIIVGWTRVHNKNTATKKTVILYHVLIRPDNFNTGKYQNPVVRSVWENKNGMSTLF